MLLIDYTRHGCEQQQLAIFHPFFLSPVVPSCSSADGYTPLLVMKIE